MIDASNEELLITAHSSHMYFDTDGSTDQSLCGFWLPGARRSKGKVTCGRCLRSLRVTERFYNKHGWDCTFQLVDGRVKVTDGASVKKNTRTAEVLVNGYWQNMTFQRIGKGDVFRLFEEDGSPVDHGQVCIAEEPARASKDGVYGVKCKPLGREEKPVDAKEGMIIWIDGEPLRFLDGVWEAAGLDRKVDTP